MRPPAFQIYPKDFLTDDKVAVMDNECLGIYIKLLFYDWINDGIPQDPTLWAKMCGFEFEGKDSNLDRWETMLKNISQCFSKHPKKNGFFTNKRLRSQRIQMEEFKHKMSEAGKAGARLKLGLSKASTRMKGKPSSAFCILHSSNSKEKTLVPVASQPGTGQPTSPRDLKSEALEVLKFMNDKTGRLFRAVPTNLDLISSRLKSGVSVADCRQVIANRCLEWESDPKMKKYLQISTLFRASNFEQYFSIIQGNREKIARGENI